MNFKLPDIPARPQKPRKTGLTMVMDKGLGLQEAANLIETYGEITDLVKLGFGSSLVTPNLEKKINMYHSAGLMVYFGGTLFEAFLVRGMYDDYVKLVDKYQVKVVEVSDGSIHIDHALKCQLINKLSKKYTVLSEVGSKEEGIIIHPAKWISMMKKELEAGSWKVIAEARESGNVGIYHRDGKTHTMLIDKITARINPEDIMWEAPQKNQQVWFIRHFGPNVNLGNIAPSDVIPLETLRLGLRGDTFFSFLNADMQKPVSLK